MRAWIPSAMVAALGLASLASADTPTRDHPFFRSEVMNHFVREIRVPIEREVEALISSDQRIPFADRNALAQALSASISEENVRETATQVLMEQMSTGDLEKLGEHFNRPEAKKGLELESRRKAFLTGLLKRRFEEKTQLKPEKNLPAPANAKVVGVAGSLTRKIWKYFPSTLSCRE